MVDLQDIYPIGSIVQLKTVDKKIMIIGIVQTEPESNTTYDYSGLVYPEGLVGQDQFLFNHEDIVTLVFRGFEDEERKQMLSKLESELAAASTEDVVQIMDIFVAIHDSKSYDNTVVIDVNSLARQYGVQAEDIVDVINLFIDEEMISVKDARKNKFLITHVGIESAKEYKQEKSNQNM